MHPMKESINSDMVNETLFALEQEVDRKADSSGLCHCIQAGYRSSDASNTDEWTINVFDMAQRVTLRINSRVWVGQELGTWDISFP